MRCLVTGGAGFIGCALTNRLVREGHQVRVLDDLSAGDPSGLHADALFTRGGCAGPSQALDPAAKGRLRLSPGGACVSPGIHLVPPGVQRRQRRGHCQPRRSDPRRRRAARCARFLGHRLWPAAQAAGQRDKLAPSAGPLRGQQAGRRVLSLCAWRVEWRRDDCPAHLQRLRARPAHSTLACASRSGLPEERSERGLGRDPRRWHANPRLCLH